MLHTFNAHEMINLQSETNYAFHTSVAEDEFPQVHDFYELSLITAGKMQLIVNQEVFLAEPGFLVSFSRALCTPSATWAAATI